MCVHIYAHAYVGLLYYDELGISVGLSLEYANIVLTSSKHFRQLFENSAGVRIRSSNRILSFPPFFM